MVKTRFPTIFVVAALALISVLPLSSQEENFAIREDFNDLRNWESFTFKNEERHSKYIIESDGEESYLKTESDNSVSAIIYKNEFNVYKFPKLKWRWKVNNVYKKGDAKTKEGDDYPLRVYVIFEYDPERVGFLERTKYNAAKLIYGKYPPDSSLNYIWANRNHTEEILTSTYTNRSKMILLQKGDLNAGKWITEEVDILMDYRRAFGEKPPAQATLGIMNDSDHTGEKSVSYIDNIELYDDVSAR